MAGGNVEIKATLRKRSEFTKQLNSRYFVLSGARIRYWETAAHAVAGKPPRAEGTVMSTDEWWPTENVANGFMLRVELSDARPCSYFLVAATVGEKLQWMQDRLPHHVDTTHDRYSLPSGPGDMHWAWFVTATSCYGFIGVGGQPSFLARKNGGGRGGGDGPRCDETTAPGNISKK